VLAIPGTRKLTRLEENVGAAALRLSADDLAELDAMPAAVGGRYG
jgi:aryl-alcohol dehydrogenase-like predicted oxidoreductase